MITIRTITIALGAATVLATAALAPTAASAAPHGHHWGHGHYGFRGGFPVGFYAPAFASASDCYVVRRVVMTPYGKRLRNVTVCE